MSGHDDLERAFKMRDDLVETAVQLEVWRRFLRKHDPERAAFTEEEEAVLAEARDILRRIADDTAEFAVEAYDEEQDAQEEGKT
jgi:hypothetical protein